MAETMFHINSAGLMFMKQHPNPFAQGKIRFRFMNCCCETPGHFRIWFGYINRSSTAIYHADFNYNPSTHQFVDFVPPLVYSGCDFDPSEPDYTTGSYTLITSYGSGIWSWGFNAYITNDGGSSTSTNVLVGLLISPLNAPRYTTWAMRAGVDEYPAVGDCNKTDGKVICYIQKMTDQTWTI